MMWVEELELGTQQSRFSTLAFGYSQIVFWGGYKMGIIIVIPIYMVKTQYNVLPVDLGTDSFGPGVNPQNSFIRFAF